MVLLAQGDALLERRFAGLEVFRGQRGIEGRQRNGELAHAGLSPTQQVSAQRSMIAFCFGFVLTHTRGLVETREQAQETWDQYDPNQFPAEHFPHLAALGVEFVRTKAEDDFRFLVQAWLDAVERAGASRPG